MADGLGLGDAYGATLDRIKGQGGEKSRLGMDIEHAARMKPHPTTAITRLMVVLTIGRHARPLAPGNHMGASGQVQPRSLFSNPR